jgi:hypothetical protein
LFPFLAIPSCVPSVPNLSNQVPSSLLVVAVQVRSRVTIRQWLNHTPRDTIRCSSLTPIDVIVCCSLSPIALYSHSLLNNF